MEGVLLAGLYAQLDTTRRFVHMLLSLDVPRPLSSKEHTAFTKRHERLTGRFGDSALAATTELNKLASAVHELKVRDLFSYLKNPIDDPAVSDRRAPRRELRPSATRISSSQGAALRLYLAALAVAQTQNRAGSRAKLPELPIVAFKSETGWGDRIATGAEKSGKGAYKAVVRDLKGRSVRSALNSLFEAGLVELPGTPGRRGRHEGFTLLHEAGRQYKNDPHPYVVPREKDSDFFRLPAGFISQGWIHVLEDSEINLLLMVACGKRALPPSFESDINLREIAIPADIRLHHYGIHRDPFSAARKTLSWFGLLKVREVNRHDDGRAEGGDARLHRLELVQDGFDTDALTTVRTVLEEQLRLSPHATPTS